MTDEEVRALWGSLNGDRSTLARVKDEGFYKPLVNNNDEFNDILNYAPTEGQQTYFNGTDEAGNPILGNTINDFMSQPQQPKAEDNSFFAGTSWGGDINAAEASERILADEEGGETNLPELIDGGRVDLGQELSALHDRMKDTSLYAQYMYSADDWAEKGKEIFDATGMDVNSLGDKNIFEKAWNLTREIKRQKALATDASGHVNMDKVYEAMPYLRDIHEAHGTAAAVMVMNSAKELQTINDVYDSEAARFAASIGYGIYRGGLSVVNQYTGAKAMARGLWSNKGLTQEEMNDILWVADEMKKLPQNSYSSFGSILGGVLGSAAENAPIMLPEMIRTAAVNLGKLTGPAGMAASAGVYALMSAQIGGAQYIENITKTDENGNPIYTPRQAALLSAFQGFAEAALEKRSIAAAGKAVFSAGTAKKLSELAAKDVALASGQTMSGVTREAAREILRERIQHGFKAGILSGAAELEEEFEQQISDMVLENMAQIAFRGGEADVSSVDEILSEAFGAAVEALPAVAGFGFMGAGGSVVADTERVLSMRERFANAKASEIARGIYENQHQQNIVYNVAENLDNVQELQGKAPEIVTEILDAQNKKAGAEDTDVNIGMLMQKDGGADIVNQIAAENGTSQEDVQACINGTGFLTVKTSALQQAIHKMTPEQKQTVFPNVAAVGHQTNEQIISYARDMKAALEAVKDKTDKETAATIERFVRESFEDEETRKAAAEIIASDTDNPYEAAKRRVRANQADVDEYLKDTIDALKAEAGQGTSVVETMDEKGDVATGRASNNPLWYQNFYADTGRAPTNADYERIAYENLTGTATRYAMMSYGNLTPEDVAYFEGVKNELDALLSEKERLRTIADALKGFGKGDFLPTASMPAETRQAYNSIYQILSASDNKKVRDNARVNAILAARMLSRLGFMWKDDAGRDVNLMEILPKLAANAVYQAEDKSAYMQEMTRQIDEVRAKYEGTAQWMKAPNGQPTKLNEDQWLTVRTDAFKNWFGDWENDAANASKVVDENGEPRVVYHGTSADFDTFSLDYLGAASGDAGFFGKGFYFAFTEGEARMYNGRRIIDAFVNLKNPLYFIEELHTYNGMRTNTLGAENVAFVLNIAEKFPELAKDHVVDAWKRTGDGESETKELSFAEFAKEVKNVISRKKFRIDEVENSYGEKEYILTADKKQKTYTDGNGKKRKYIDYGFQKRFLNKEDAENKLLQAYYYLSESVYDGIDIPRAAVVVQETDFNEALLKRGYDGVLQSKEGDEVVAFEPTQIKAATGNNGQYLADDPNMYHQFAGENAETADKAKLAEAQRMDDDGAKAEDIYKATGWLKGRDGKWRFEIPDNLDKIDFSELENSPFSYLALGRIYDNPALYEAYPWLENISVGKAELPMSTQAMVRYQFNEPTILLNQNRMDDLRIKNSLVHEIQHLIQMREGFAGGGSPETALYQVEREIDRLETAWEKISDKARDFLSIRGRLDNSMLGIIELSDDKLASLRKELQDVEKTLPEDEKKNASNIKGMLMRLKRIADKYKNDPNELYYDLGGEQEARTAASRADTHTKIAEARTNLIEAEVEFDRLKNSLEGDEKAKLEEFLAAREETRKAEEEVEKSGADSGDEAWAKMDAAWQKEIDLYNALPDRIHEAVQNVDNAEWNYSLVAKEFMEELPQPHNINAVVVFDGRDFPYNEATAQNVEQALDMLMQAAWHGSPYSFTQFDLGAIGTGEGHQVHGWGLYFAQDRKISEGYKNILAKREVEVNGRTYYNPDVFDESFSLAESFAIGALIQHYYDKAGAIDYLKGTLQRVPEGRKKTIAEAINLIETDKIKLVSETTGSLYRVEIPEENVMLDEQKMFDEQPSKVKKALTKIIKNFTTEQLEELGIDVSYYGRQKSIQQALELFKNTDGKKIYGTLWDAVGGDREASELLNEYGIKGITYGGERDGRCYVVFDDKAVSIIDTYNQRVNGETYRGGFSAAMNFIKLFQDADESTFMHEMSHFYLNELQKIAMNAGENSQAAKDLATINGWAEWKEGDAEEYKGTASASEFAKREKQIKEAQQNGFAVMEDGTKKTLAELLNEWRQEKFARGFEEYLHEGKAPTSTLKRIFRRFRDWLKQIYKDVTGAGVKPSAEVEAVFARMIASDEEIEMQATIDRAADISRIDPDLMDADTEAMHERWAEEAKEEAKDKLRKELLKEQREKDVAAHMEAYEAEERSRLMDIPAFQAELFVQEAGLPEEEAAEAVGYTSAEAWKEDLKELGGSYENAVKMSCEAERDRYIREMPNDVHLQELAEEALVSSEYAGRLASLEAEALRRREKKYANAPKRLAKAMEGMEAALAEEKEEPLEKALRTLKYSFRWQRQQQEQIEAMQSTIDEMKARIARDKEASENAAAQSEADKEALREKMEKQAEKGKEKLRAKLKEQVNTFKNATMLNAEWLRGVRDAADGMYKMNRELAKQQLAAMPVKDSTNVRRFIGDARKAAAESARAIANAVRKNNGLKKADTGEKDYEKARQAKLRQALFGAQAREALNLRRELQRLVNHLKRREKTLAKEKHGEIDASTKYYINHILYMMGFKTSDAIRPQTLESFGAHIASLKDAWDADNEANGNVGDLDMDFDVPDWLLNLATSGDKQPPGNYREFTMAELQDVKTLVDILYTTGRNKNRLLSMDRNKDEVVFELMQDFDRTVTVEKGDTGISSVMASLLQPVVMLKTLGTKWKQYFYDTLADAWERKTAMQQQAAQDLNALFEKHWDKKTRRKMRTKKLGITLPDGTELTKEGVISMALNWGNDGNRKRLMNGFLMTDRDVEEIFKQTMTANDWAFIQEAWDYINTYGDKVNKVVEKSTGTPMKRVEPRSFIVETEDGKTISLRGGYYPISYDPVKSLGHAEQELMSASQAMGGASAFGTGMGSTKARSENGLQESPLLLSADVLFRHINQQIHIATMRLACRDVYKLLNDSSVRGMITSSLGNEAYKELKRWVENCWQEPRGANDWVHRAIGYIRGKTVTAIMAYRTSVAILNLANTAYMARELGAWNALCALADYYSRPFEIKNMRKAILEQSPFMANRANNIDRDIRKAQENSFAPGNPLSEMISEYGSWAIEETDMLCSMPTYHWTYKQTLNVELEKGTKPEDAKKKAHRAAEDVVRKIFGSADTVDQSAIQRSKDEFIKALTPFYTFVSTQANAIFEGYLKGRYQGSVRSIRDDGTIQAEKKAFLRRYWTMANAFLWTNIIGTLAEQILRDAIGKLTGDDDDGLLDPTSEAFLRRWTSQSMTTFTSAVPIGNIIGEALGAMITKKYYGSRNFGVAEAALGRYADAVKDMMKLLEGKKDVIDAGRSVAKAIGGSGFGMPDTFTDAIFNAARAYRDNYSLNEWFIKSLFDKKLKKKGR